MANFRFVGYPVRVHAGEDAISHLPEEIDRTRASRVLVVGGQSVSRETGLLTRTNEALGERLAGVYDGVATGSPLTAVLPGVVAARECAADCIVAIGGGSAVVTARAITILLAEGGTAQEHATKYLEGRPPVSPRLMQPKIPNFLVLTTPTTAGTRAGTAVIDPETGHRLEMFDPKTRPSALFWDDAALLTASPELCLSAAAACYSGVVGALQQERLNPLAESDLREALRLLAENMPRVSAEPDDAEVRTALCSAAFLYNRAGDAGAGGGALGVVSALAHSLDTRYPDCRHGDAYAILTAPGMRFNAGHNGKGQARLARVLETDGIDAAADRVAATLGGLGLPSRLRQVGVTEAGLSQLAEDAMSDFGLHRNPRPVRSADDLLEILGAAL